jgi:alpha-glucosidase
MRYLNCGDTVRAKVFAGVQPLCVCISLGCGQLMVSAQDICVSSPDSSAVADLRVRDGRLSFGVRLNGRTVLEQSPLHFTVDGTELTAGVEAGRVGTSEHRETYAWRGVHSVATNRYRLAAVPLLHKASGMAYTLEVRVFKDAAAFRFVVPPGIEPRVPDEATMFELPAGSTVWSHDLGGHYEGLYSKQTIEELKPGHRGRPGELQRHGPAGAGQ